jgi:death on curing protein
VSLAVVLAIQDEQIAHHGGLPGLRDMNLLESALAKPQQVRAYNDDADMADLAASYAFGIARSHAFFDGNKRASNAVTVTFLELNGYELLADDAEQVEIWTRIGDGSMTEAKLSDWFRHYLGKI